MSHQHLTRRWVVLAAVAVREPEDDGPLALRLNSLVALAVLVRTERCRHCRSPIDRSSPSLRRTVAETISSELVVEGLAQLALRLARRWRRLPRSRELSSCQCRNLAVITSTTPNMAFLAIDRAARAGD